MTNSSCVASPSPHFRGPSDEHSLLSLQGPQSPEPTCAACHPSCIHCRGPGAWNCTVCPALQLLSDDGRCLSCCGDEMRHDGTAIPRECCNCSAALGGRAGGPLTSSRLWRCDSSHISPVFQMNASWGSTLFLTRLKIWRLKAAPPSGSSPSAFC